MKLNKLFYIKNDVDKKLVNILGFTFKISRFSLQKIHKIDKSKKTIALQVHTNFDKSGVAEVVFNVAKKLKDDGKYNVVIISAFSQKGYMANIAKKYGIYTYSFFNNVKNIPVLVKKLNIEIVNLHFDLSSVVEYKALGVKTVYTIHNNYIFLNEEEVNKRKELYKYVDKFISVSDQVKSYFSKKFEIAEEKIQTIVNGIEYADINAIEPINKSELGFSENDFVYISVVNFNTLKNHFAIVLATEKLIQKYPNIKIVLIGYPQEPDYYNYFREYLNNSPAKNNIKIINFSPKKDVYRYLQMSNCFLLPSISEGFSIASLEAMLFSKPLILSNVGGAEHCIKNNDIGLLIPQPVNLIEKLNDYSIYTALKDFKTILDKPFTINSAKYLLSAMEDIYLTYDKWEEKAKLGNLKIKNEFNVDVLLCEYINFLLN